MHGAAETIVPRFQRISAYQWTVIVVIILLLVQEGVVRIIKRNLKHKYLIDNPHGPKGKNDNYLLYHKKSQTITLIRVIITIIALVVLLSQGQNNVWSFFAVGLGAIVITFQSVIQSVMVYFTILLQYKAGETIAIGEKQGEIISIKPLFLGIAGITDNGEHNGMFYIIPNKVILEAGIQKLELRSSSIQKVIITATFNQKYYTVSFDEMLSKLEVFLDATLPKREANQVGYFKSYSGHKYKLNIDYADDKECSVLITITFLEKLSQVRNIKRKIISFIEGFKKI